MIELIGLKNVRETRKGLDETKFAHTERNRIYSSALIFAEEQFQSDLTMINAELMAISRDVGHPVSYSKHRVDKLISAIHSALKVGEAK